MKILFLLSILLQICTKSEAMVNESETIKYNISFTQPQAHYVDVEMIVSNNIGSNTIVKLPVWAPGSYLIREFSKNIESIQAINNTGKSLKINKISKNAWKIATVNKQPFRINYRIYAFETSVRTSFVNNVHAFLSSPDIFLHIDGQLGKPAQVKINLPERWKKISTSLTKLNSNTFFAKNFDELYDNPIEIGNQETFTFTAAKVKHEVAMVNGGNYDSLKLKKDLTKIVESATEIFKENPNKYYLFIVHNYESGGGGLEHKSCTVLGASRNGYADENTYNDFLRLAAHEYFHLWNVKRLRPIALGPFNYDEENYTTNLWIAEGFTAYYENIINVRAGILPINKFLNDLQDDISAISNQPGNKIQSVADASFDAWIKYYRPNENSNNSTISYYSKGALIALLFNLKIIEASKGKYNLDDAMLEAYNIYYKKLKRGYTDDEFKLILEKFAGQSLTEDYNQFINGTEDLNFDPLFEKFGLSITNTNAFAKQPYLGASVVLNEKGYLKIRSIARNSAAYHAGLNVNDIILSVNGINFKDIKSILSDKKPGDKLDFYISRDGLEENIEVILKENLNKSFEIKLNENLTQEQKLYLKKWLGNVIN